MSRAGPIAATLVVALLGRLPAAAETVAIGSKNFAENRLLGEAVAQLIEARTDLAVDRRLGLAGTEFCFEALRTGAIDLYPEYTGTALVTILGREPGYSAAETLSFVRREFLDRWNLWWLAPLGFENAYEIAVPRKLAQEQGLRTLSDLATVASELRAGLGYEFMGRADGLPGLGETYGLRFKSVQGMQQALKYQAAGSGDVDVIDVYTTDGRLLVHDLVILEDDLDFFPPYAAGILVRGETLEKHGELGAVIGLLAGALDGNTMRSLNLRLQETKEPEAVVARDLLRQVGLLTTIPQAPGTDPERPSDAESVRSLPRLTAEHLVLCLISLGLGILVAVPLGLLLERHRRFAETIIRTVGTSQTIPSLALLGFLIPFLGVGIVPTIVALWTYSIFPILRNTFSGVRDADPQAVEAATALGMTRAQVLRQVRLPLAIPTIMAGVRTAGVITVGTATLAAFIGAGGLGEPIIAGVQLLDTRRILSGAIPAALLALGVDMGLGTLERALTPRGLKEPSTSGS